MKKKMVSMLLLAVMALSAVMPAMAAGGNGSGGGKGNGGGQSQNKVPALVSTIPADGATDVALDQQVTLQFSNNVTWSNKSKDHMYLNNVKLVTLKDDKGNAVAAKVTPPAQSEKDSTSKEYQKLFVKPEEALTPETTYTVEVAAGIVANNGQASKEAYKVTFTTASAVEKPWYTDAQNFVADNDLFKGSTTAFTPNTVMTRGLVVQVLHNLEKNPAATATNTFGDVAADSWYFDAVNWAAGKGIVNGNGLGFAPEEAVTREQLATILWRYSGKPKATTEAAFADQATVSSYAQEAVDWAADIGLLQGMTDNTLSPKTGVTHAQAATMVMRLAAAK